MFQPEQIVLQRGITETHTPGLTVSAVLRTCYRTCHLKTLFLILNLCSDLIKTEYHFEWHNIMCVHKYLQKHDISPACFFLHPCCKWDACKHIVLHPFSLLHPLIVFIKMYSQFMLPHMQMIYKSLYPAPGSVSLIKLFTILCWYHDSIMCLILAADLNWCECIKLWSSPELVSSLCEHGKRLTAAFKGTVSY